MREIKFRVWDNDVQEMFEIAHIDFLDELVWYYPEVSTSIDALEPNEQWGYSKPLKDALQYTGLKDKNGKEIYEGDIVKKGQYVGTVEYLIRCGYCGPGIYIKDIKKDILSLNPSHKGKTEYIIIGNIYENPELLIIPDSN